MPFNNTSVLLNVTVENATNLTYQFYQTEQLVFLCILFAMIVIGNTLVLAAILTSEKRRSRMNFFIINLACADLSVGCVTVLTDIVWKVTITWYAGNISCKLVRFSQCVATYGATYSLVALSIDRFDAIARPMNMNNTERRCRILVGLAWSFAILFSTPMLYMSKELIIDGKQQCWMDLPTWMWQLYMTLVSLAVFIVPAIIIASCYIIIVVIIWSKSKKFKGSSTCASSQRYSSEKSRCVSHNASGSVTVRFSGSTRSQPLSGASSSRGVIPKAKIKTIKMTFVIVLAFICCWSPYFIWDLLHVYGHISSSQHSIAVSTFIQSLAPLNSAANPLIYTLFNTVMCTRVFKKHTSFYTPPTSHTAVPSMAHL